jgi:hypothetical protein
VRVGIQQRIQTPSSKTSGNAGELSAPPLLPLVTKAAEAQSAHLWISRTAFLLNVSFKKKSLKIAIA